MRTLLESYRPARARPRSPHASVSAPVSTLRILHVVPHLGMGGTELALLNVVRSLSDASFRHSVCAVRSCDSNIASLAVVDQVFDASNGRKGLELSLPRLMAVMKEYRPHVVHSRNWGSIEAIPAARLARVPVVVHSEHGYELDNLAGLPLRRRLFRRVVYSMVDAVFTVSKELRDYHARQAWIPPERIRVIYNGVDTHRFVPDPRARSMTRKQLGVPEDAFVFGSVGRLVAIKDHGTLLRAGEVLQRRGRSIHILLVGSGPELDRLQKNVSHSPELRGRVHFAGTSHDVPNLLNAMDAFVLPSICEGMSNTLLEAMASGLPVLATRVGGNPEVLKDDGGWLFAPGDTDTLAARLEELARDHKLRRQLGDAGRLRVVRHFSLEHMAEQYRSLYFDLADRRGLLGQPRVI